MEIQIIKANFAEINEDNNCITLYESMPRANGMSLIIQNCNITIEDGVLSIMGSKILWGFVCYKTFTKDLDKKPVIEHTKLSYRTFLDFFKGVKSRYVPVGWYRLQQTSGFVAKMNKWFLVL